jgi:plasmid stabilization system protein ParE
MVISAKIRQDNLEDIIYYIALDSPTRATSVTKELVTSISNTLSTLPEGGIKHKGNIRKISYKGYTAFYRVKKHEKLVEILHFVNLSNGHLALFLLNIPLFLLVSIYSHLYFFS